VASICSIEAAAFGDQVLGFGLLSTTPEEVSVTVAMLELSRPTTVAPSHN
jgi:hypothetical protein